jgi:hypothetical protein
MSCYIQEERLLSPLTTLAISLECGAELRGMTARRMLEERGWRRVPGRVHLFEKSVRNVKMTGTRSKKENAAEFDEHLAGTATDLMLVLKPVSADAPPKGKQTFIAVGRLGQKKHLESLPSCWKRLRRRRLMFIAPDVTWKDSGAQSMPADVLFYRLLAGDPFPSVVDPDPRETAKSVLRGIGIRF